MQSAVPERLVVRVRPRGFLKRYIYITDDTFMFQMIQKWSRYRILEQFFDYPKKPYFIRELSRKCKLAQTAIRIHLRALQEEGLITKDNSGIYASFKAARNSPLFKLLKTQDVVVRAHQSGLIQLLGKRLYPGCVVLFGSASRGEDTEESDIDLFVQASQTSLDLHKFEKTLNRRIHILYEPQLKELAPELLNNIANGIVLDGYLKVV
jgi:predicted nucleotidyltransferase